MKNTRRIALATLCAAAWLSAAASPQSTGANSSGGQPSGAQSSGSQSSQSQGEKPPISPELLEAIAGGEDPRQEMIELFRKVEGTLEEIDKLLYEAGAGERSAKDAARESGLAELLQRSKTKSSEVVSGIDRILEIAKQQGGT